MVRNDASRITAERRRPDQLADAHAGRIEQLEQHVEPERRLLLCGRHIGIGLRLGGASAAYRPPRPTARWAAAAGRGGSRRCGSDRRAGSGRLQRNLWNCRSADEPPRGGRSSQPLRIERGEIGDDIFALRRIATTGFATGEETAHSRKDRAGRPRSCCGRRRARRSSFRGRPRRDGGRSFACRGPRPSRPPRLASSRGWRLRREPRAAPPNSQRGATLTGIGQVVDVDRDRRPAGISSRAGILTVTSFSPGSTITVSAIMPAKPRPARTSEHQEQADQSRHEVPKTSGTLSRLSMARSRAWRGSLLAGLTLPSLTLQPRQP